MKKLYDIIINPVSGKGKGKKALSSVLKFLNANDVDHKIYLTTKRGDAEKFAKELTSGEEERNIVAIGGDGTFSEVLDGIVNFEKTMLGFIMSGTGNDFGSHLKLNKDPERAFKDILGGWVEYVDFIQLKNSRCLNICGTGIDVDTLIRYSQAKRKNKLTYLTSLFKTLRHPSYYEYEIHFENESGEMEQIPREPCLITAVCNGNSCGGGIPISPSSKSNDGTLDLIFLSKPTNNRYIAAMKLKKGKHTHYPYFHHIKTKKVVVEKKDNEEFTYQSDGELIKDNKFTAEVVSNKLKVFMPKRKLEEK